MTYAELQKKYQLKADYWKKKREFDSLGLTNFGNDVRGIYESLNSYLTGGWSDPTAGAAQKQSVNALLSRIAGVKNYMNAYASDYDANELSTRLSELDELEKSLKEGLSYLDKQIEINSGFKNADEYNAAYSAYQNREELEKFGSAYADKDAKWLTNAASELRTNKKSYDLGRQGAAPIMMPNGQMSDEYIDSIFKQYGANADNALDYADKFEQLANLRYADMFKTMDQDALSSYSSGLQGAMDAYSKAQNDFARFRSPENETKLRDAEKNLRQNFGVTPETASSKLTEAKGLINAIEVDNLQKWASQQADFSEKSIFREGSYSNGVEGGFGGLINNTQRAKDDYRSNFGNKGWSNVNSIENPFVTSLKADKVSEFEIFQKYTTDEQRATYNYILNTIGEAAATKYAEALKAEFEKQNKKDTTEEWTQFSKENPWGASAASVFMNVTTGPFAGLSAAKDYLLTGTVNDDSPISTLHSSVDTVRSAVPQAWAEKYGWDDTGKGVASFFYGTGMSIADSTANNLVWGGYLGGAPGKVISQVAMGLTAGASVARQAKENGATDQEAFNKGVAAGVFEAIFEGLALDELLKIGGKQNIVKAVLNQMKTEGLEEMGTEVANILADTLIMTDRSELVKKFESYKGEGLDDAGASLRTLLDTLGEVGLAGAAGAISGGVMGGTFSLLNVGSQKISNADLGTQIIRMGGVQAVVDAGLKFGEGSEAYELASKLQKRSNHRLQQAAKKAGANTNVDISNSQTIGNLNKNGQQSTASPMQIAQNKNGNSGAYRGAIDAADAGKLYRIIFTENKKQYFDHYTKVYEQKLSDMGVNASRSLARAVVLTISGENTTPEQTRLVANSREAQTLIKESGLALDLGTEFNPLQKKTTYQTDDGLVIISRKGASAKYDVTLIKNEQLSNITPKSNEKSDLVDISRGRQSVSPQAAQSAAGQIGPTVQAQRSPQALQTAQPNRVTPQVAQSAAKMGQNAATPTGSAQSAAQTAKAASKAAVSERTLTARSLSQVESIVETLREGASIGEVMSRGYTAEELSTDSSKALSYESAMEAGASEFVANTAAALSEAFSGNLRVYFDNAGSRRRGVYRKEHDGTRSVVINPNSAADVDGVITHEVFHDLENTAAGRAFIELAVEYAKAQPSKSGDFDNRYEEIYDLYVKDGRTRLADIPGEVGAKVASEIIGRESSLAEILNKMGEREASELVKKLKRGAATLKNKLSKVDKTKVKGRALAERRAARLVELYEKAAKQRALEDKLASAAMTGEIGADTEGNLKTTRGSKTGKKPENPNVTTKSENKTQVSENKTAENKKASRDERGDELGITVKYFLAEENDDSSIKQQIAAHLEDLANSDPVFNVKYSPINKKQLHEKISEEFGKIGYKVDRQNFGIIEIGEKEINKSINYLGGDSEKAAMFAIPAVLKRGTIVSGHNNHKGREYDTVTIAAKIQINGKEGIVGAIVTKIGGKNKYRVHRILMPDGSRFVFEEKKNAEPTSVEPLTKDIKRATISSASNNSISQKSDLSIVKERFDLSEIVEETEDLIAMHNVRADKLADALRLGGLPMPSIAITKKDIAHTNYGDITLLFRKETIDPQADSRNKVYGSDAWTPTIRNATTEYEVNVEKSRALEKKLDKLSQKIAGGVFASSSLIRSLGIDSISEQNADKISERIARSDGARAAYLAAMGGDIEPEYRTKEYSKFGNKALKTFTKKVGAQKLAEIIAEIEIGNRDATRAYEETARKIIRDNYAEEHAESLAKRPDLAEKRIDLYMERHATPWAIEDFINDAWTFYQAGENDAKEIDKIATSDKLNQAVDDADVKAWLEPQVAEILGDIGIYNGKEPFNANGDRRGFFETHYTYTAENIVKAMQNASSRGEGTFGANANALVATATPSYKSIKEMHADKGRLRIEEQADYDHTLRAIDEVFSDIKHDIRRSTNHRTDNTFDEEEIIGSIIVEAAMGSRTVIAIQRAFAKEGYKISADQAKKIIDLYRKAANVPTGYYEAKPERVVGFDEVEAFIVPNYIDAKLKRELIDRGYNVVEYSPEVADDRKNVVNSFENVRFDLDERYGEDGRMKRQAVAEYKAYSSTKMREVLNSAAKLITVDAINKDWKPGDPYFTNIKTNRASIDDMAKQLSNMFNFAQEKNATEADIKAMAKVVAEYLIANTYADDAEFLDRLTTEQDLASRALAVISHGLRKMEIGETEIGDIRAKYGKKKARAVVTRWRATDKAKAKGTISPTEIAAELADAGIDIRVENDSWADSDIIIAINELYERSKATFDETVRSQIGSAEEYAALRDKLADQIYDAYRDGLSDVRVAQATAAAKVIVDVVRAKELGRRKRSSGALAATEWKNLVEAIGKISSGYNISVPAVRDFAAKYVAFISKQASELNVLINDNTDQNYDAYIKARTDTENQVLSAIDPTAARGVYAIAEGDESTSLTADELEALHAGIRNLLALDNRYNRIFKDGRWVDTDKYAKTAVGETDSVYGKKKAKAKDSFFATQFTDTLDPRDAVARVGGYKRNGILALGVRDIQNASVEAKYKEMQYMRDVENFFAEHKDYARRYEKDRIEFKYVRENPITHEKTDGTLHLTVGEFLSLYMTSKRKQAFISLAWSEVKFEAAKGIRKNDESLSALKPNLEGLTDVQIEAIARGMGNGLISQINQVFKENATKEDREFVSLVEKFFATDSKNDKMETDMMLYGYTNVVDGYYYPIARDGNAFDVNLIGSDRRLDAMIGVNSFSFNQKTVEKANKPLLIRDAMTVMQRHAHQLAIYSTMTVPLQNVNRIYNCHIDYKGKTTTLKSYIIEHVSKDFEKYFRNYMLDAQGTSKARGDEATREWVSKLTSRWAKGVLALNVKSAASQFSTEFNMFGQVSVGSWAKGAVMGSAITPAKLEEMDKYSHGAAVRNDSNEQYLATGAMGKVDRTTDKLMVLQVATDRATCFGMWNMCQYEVQKTKGYAIGSEQNKIEAGRLLDEKILDLQDTSGAATKTGLARSTDGLFKSFAMFRSSELKQWSRLCYMIGEGNALGWKGRRKAFAKEFTAFLASKLYVVALGLLWQHLRGKWPKDEEGNPVPIWQEGLTSLALDMIGFVPIIGDLAEAAITGFTDFSTPVGDVLGDLIGAGRKLYSNTADLISDIGDGRWDRAGNHLESYISSLSTLVQDVIGIPANNILNLVNIIRNGVAELVPDDIMYGVSDIFREKNYLNDLKDALKNGDTALAETIIDLMITDRTGQSAGGDAAHEIYDLYSAGYEGLLPSKTPTKVTITKTDVDGKEVKSEIELDEKQRRDYEKEYSKSTSIIKRLIASETYEGLTSDERASAISDVYDLCRERAKTKVLGADMSTAVAATYFISDTVYIAARAHIKAIKADESIKNKKLAVQRYLRSLGLSRIEQNVLLYVSGYRSETERSIVLRAVRALDLANEEKFAIATALGFKIKGTRIVSE